MFIVDQDRFSEAHRRLTGRVRQVLHPNRGETTVPVPHDDLAHDPVWEWLRAILPAEASQCADITCDSWNNPRLRVQIVTDAAGQLIVANRAVLRDIIRIIDSGASVVVQVCSTETGRQEEAATIRIWLFNRRSPRAVTADTVRTVLLPDERAAYRQSGARFETGWPITGEPGGGVSHAHGGRGSWVRSAWWPAAAPLRA